ncbi:MAG: glycosyltransferase family 4 protein, partial [Patescibacteria group bacterium]
MKILVFSTAYYPFVGGAEVAIKEISDRLPEHEWHVITARMSRSLPKMERVFGVTVHRVGVGFKTVDKFLLPFLGARTARSLARSGSIDRIWGMMASQGSLGAAFFKRSVPTVPFVLTLQEGDEEAYLARYVGGSQILYKLFIRPWYRYIFKKADRVTVISRYLGDRARAALFSGPVDLVPNAVDLARFTPGAERTPDGRTVLVTTSRLVEKNAVGDIIAALVLLPKSVHLSVIGEGPLGSALRQQVQVLGLSDRVVFHGHKEHAEMIILLRQADIFIRPSLSEGLGISFLEAMAMRLPVVATLVGGIPDFLADGVTGVACKPHDPASIAMAVERLTGDSALRERIIENAQQMIQDRYDWNSIAREMEKSLEEATLLGRSVV